MDRSDYTQPHVAQGQWTEVTADSHTWTRESASTDPRGHMEVHLNLTSENTWKMFSLTSENT